MPSGVHGSREPDHFPTRTRPPATLSAASQTTVQQAVELERVCLHGWRAA